MVVSKDRFQWFKYGFVSCFIIFFSTNSFIECLHSNKSLQYKLKLNTIHRCICPLDLFTEDCRIEESVLVKPVIFTDPSWDDFSSKSSFKSMENQICEEMGNIFGAKRVWCRLIYSRKENKIDPTSQGFNENGHHQDEPPLDNGYIESYDTPCNDHLCKSYERCTYKGMGYKCKCKLFKYGKPCISTKVCNKDSCKHNQTCTALEDCRKCDCNLFKLEQVCIYAGFNLLFSGLITFCTLAIFLFIFVGRRPTIYFWAFFIRLNGYDIY